MTSLVPHWTCFFGSLLILAALVLSCVVVVLAVLLSAVRLERREHAKIRAKLDQIREAAEGEEVRR